LGYLGEGMQKSLKLSVIIFIIASAFFFAACGNNGENNNGTILVNSVTVAETEQVSLLKNDTYSIYATVLPDNATNKTVQFISMNPSVATVDATGLVTAMNAGSTTITVKSTDGSNKQASVSFRVHNQATQLSVPTNFRLTEDMKLTWNEVPGAPAYEVTLDGLPLPDTSLTEYEISSFNALHSYQVRAKGDEYIYLSSAYSSPVVAKVLSVPANFTQLDDVFSWDAVEGAAYYEVKVNGASINNELNTSIQLDLSAPQVYEVKVRAVIEEINAYSSKYTNTTIMRRLDVPQNVAQQNGGITWSPVEGASKYIVSVNEQEIEVQQTNYQLPVDAEAMEYTFKVKAAGETAQVLESVYSITFTTQKIETPQNLRIQQGKIMWDEVSLAQSYSLELNEQIIQVGSATEFSLLDGYLAGLYSIRVIANGNSTTFTSSNYSSVISANKLAKPMQVSVAAGQLKWLPVSSATRYLVTVGEATFETTATTLDPSELTPNVEYLATVQAQAEGQIYSNISTPLLVQKLSAPTNFRIEEGLLRWDSINYASSYKITAGAHSFTTGNTLNGYYLTLPGGTSYDVMVKSLGDNRKYLNSDNTPTLPTTKLATPQNLHLENGYITLDFVAGATDYVLEVNYVNYILNESEFPYYFGGTPGETYNIKAMARGDSATLLNSNYTEVLTTTQLPQVQNIFIENATIYWDHIAGVSSYEVWIKAFNEEEYNKETDLYFTSSNNFDLTFIDGGKYNVKVRAQGYQEDVLAGIESDGLYFERLNTPQSFRIEDGLLRWTYVPNATRYVLEINGAIQENVYSEFYILDNTYEVGTYDIRVAAYGDGLSYITSEWSDIISTTRMNSPQNVRVVDGFMMWDDVPQATIYVVKIGGNTYTGKATEEDPILIPRFDPPFAYPSGLQEFTVYAAAEEVLASKPSDVFVFDKVQAPTNLRIENKIIKWDSVLSSTGYRLFINDDVINTQEVTYDLTQYESYGVGTFNIRVMALGDMGDGLGNKVNSDYTNQISVTVMSAPSGLSVQNGHISWVPNNGAINYELRVYSKTAPDTYELLTNEPLYTNEVDSLNPSTTYLLDSTFPAGEYGIEIRAIGNNTTFITSEFSNRIDVIKLATPTGLGVQNGIVVYDSVANATGYQLQTILTEGETMITGLTVAQLQTSYELGSGYDAGLYDISVRAVGDDSVYLTSDLTTGISAQKLPMVENFRVEDGILKWTSVANASEYILYINHQDYFIGLTSSYELPNTFIQGNYQISIKARGTNNDYLNSSYTETLLAYKMDAVTNLTVQDGVLNWTGVNATDGYTITIVNASLQQTFDTLPGSAVSYVLPNEYSSGTYAIYVQTNGNDETNLNSVKVGNASGTGGFAITKLAVPQNVRLYEQEGENFLTWDEVPNAQAYHLVVVKDGSTLVDQVMPGRIYQISGLEVGFHYVSVQAVGDDISLVNSNMSTPLTITQPSTPQNIAVANGKVTWDASAYATEYRVHLTYNDVPQEPITVTTTHYYLTDLGLYDISVQAYYSGSLASEHTPVISHEFNLFAGGNGSVDTPFEIVSEQQLRNVRYNPTAHYILTDNIILSTNNFVPIGTQTDAFVGSFNGDYYAIANVTINVAYAHAGLFGYIGTTGEVRNVTISSANIISQSEYTGIVAGFNLGKLNHITLSGSVSPSVIDPAKALYSGGAVGRNEGVIKQVVAQVTVTPSNLQNLVYAGGIAGYNDGFIYQSGVLENSNIEANYAGGIAGLNDGMIAESYNKATVSATSRGVVPTSHAYAGGIAGFNKNSNTKTLNISTYQVGSFVGGYILNSYNHGSITATSNNEMIAYAGGIAGFNGYTSETQFGEVKFVYNAGNITATNSYPGGYSYAGGVTGWNSNAGKLAYAYYLNTSALAVTNGEQGVNTGSKTETGGDGLQSYSFAQFMNNNYTAILENQPWDSVDEYTRAQLKWEASFS
jgi:hypothetical protein